MTRNQKIALGCGGAGCLGLIIVVIVGRSRYFVWVRQADGCQLVVTISTDNRNTNSDTDSNSSGASTTLKLQLMQFRFKLVREFAVR
jgi:hypothetical protein